MGFGPVVMLTLHVASMEWKWGVHGSQTSDIKATFGVYSLFLGHKSLKIRRYSKTPAHSHFKTILHFFHRLNISQNI